MSKGRGVIVMGLEQGEKLLAAAVTRLSSVTVSGIGRGGKEKALEIKGEKLRHHIGHRARMGRVLPEKVKPTALAVPPAPKGEIIIGAAMDGFGFESLHVAPAIPVQ